MSLFVSEVVNTNQGRVIRIYPRRFASFKEAERKRARRAEAQPVGDGSSAYLVFCYIPPLYCRAVEESVSAALDEWTAWRVAAQQLRISVRFPPIRKRPWRARR